MKPPDSPLAERFFMNRPRTLAHSLADELREPRPPIEPIIVGWREAVAILLQVFLVGSLFVGILLVIFLAGA